MPQGHSGSATHGGSGTLYNKGCRCDPCRVAHYRRMAASVAKRWAARIPGENGRPYAVGAHSHGSTSTYTNWGCRCDPCTEAQRARFEKRRDDAGSV